MLLSMYHFTNIATLVIACKKYLEAHKFIYLPIILTSNCEKTQREGLINKKVKPEILASKYRLIHQNIQIFQKEIEKPFFIIYCNSACISIYRW